MTRTTVVSCDGCGSEIGPTNYMREDYLALVPMAREHRTGSIYATEIRLPHGERHFCGFRCLDEWRERQSTARS